jgi:hypothetical protein
VIHTHKKMNANEYIASISTLRTVLRGMSAHDPVESSLVSLAKSLNGHTFAARYSDPLDAIRQSPRPAKIESLHPIFVRYRQEIDERLRGQDDHRSVDRSVDEEIDETTDAFGRASLKRSQSAPLYKSPRTSRNMNDPFNRGYGSSYSQGLGSRVQDNSDVYPKRMNEDLL